MTERHRVETVAELRSIAVGSLGPMTGDTFKSFVARAKEKGLALGLAKPGFALTIEFKPGAHGFLDEIPYAPIEDEWDALVRDVYMCKAVPEVLIVDEAKNSFPI